METIRLQANAKINLTLDVLGKLDSGYHALETVMQSVTLCDQITLTKQPHGMTFATDSPLIPPGEENIAVGAARLFFAHLGRFHPGVHIHLTKCIPVEAGLAGGSADAAAVLWGLNRLYETKLSDQTLCALGAQLGADVPFCLAGGCMLAKSIGEDLQKIPSAFAAHLVIIKPQEGISTRLAFGELDRNPPKIHPDTNAMVAALAQGGLSAVCGALCNVFEEGAFRALPAIAQIKLHLQAAGALGALMSGSGSAVYGVFASPLLAQKAIARLRPCLDRVSFYLCQTASHGIYRQNDS